jgi:hypothetical protein
MRKWSEEDLPFNLHDNPGSWFVGVRKRVEYVGGRRSSDLWYLPTYVVTRLPSRHVRAAPLHPLSSNSTWYQVPGGGKVYGSSASLLQEQLAAPLFCNFTNLFYRGSSLPIRCGCPAFHKSLVSKKEKLQGSRNLFHLRQTIFQNESGPPRSSWRG